ncbi:MAG: sensor histidine kinase [Cyanobacteria bacterium P01_A01_bin.3]
MLSALKMNTHLKFRPNPFRFMLIAEWIMLASCASLAVVEAWFGHTTPVQHLLILIVLGLMGLMLPSGSLAIKVLYTALGIGAIFYGTVLGYLHILPTLYLIVVMRSCFLFKPFGRWVVAGLILFLFLTVQVEYFQQSLPDMLEEQLNFGMHIVAETLVFGLGIFLVLQLTDKFLLECSIKQELNRTNEQLQSYALKIEDMAAVQERNRIARNIHDSLGHVLTSLNIQLSTAVKLWPVDVTKAQPFLEQAQQLGIAAMKEVRHSVSTLREENTDEQPLEAKLDDLIESFRASTGISVYSDHNGCHPLPPCIAKTIFRLAQEALTNVSKHAQAADVHLHLWATKKLVCLSVTDNGVGFDPNLVKLGFGLQGMQERIAAVNGRFTIETNTGAGCSLVFEIPLASSISN